MDRILYQPFSFDATAIFDLVGNFHSPGGLDSWNSQVDRFAWSIQLRFGNLKCLLKFSALIKVFIGKEF